MALLAGTLTHINPAGLEIELWPHHRVARREDGRVDGRAVLDGADVGLPVLLARRLPGWHVTWQNLKLYRISKIIKSIILLYKVIGFFVCSLRLTKEQIK